MGKYFEKVALTLREKINMVKHIKKKLPVLREATLKEGLKEVIENKAVRQEVKNEIKDALSVFPEGNAFYRVPNNERGIKNFIFIGKGNDIKNPLVTLLHEYGHYKDFKKHGLPTSWVTKLDIIKGEQAANTNAVKTLKKFTSTPEIDVQNYVESASVPFSNYKSRESLDEALTLTYSKRKKEGDKVLLVPTEKLQGIHNKLRYVDATYGNKGLEANNQVVRLMRKKLQKEDPKFNKAYRKYMSDYSYIYNEPVYKSWEVD